MSAVGPSLSPSRSPSPSPSPSPSEGPSRQLSRVNSMVDLTDGGLWGGSTSSSRRASVVEGSIAPPQQFARQNPADIEVQRANAVYGCIASPTQAGSVAFNFDEAIERCQKRLATATGLSSTHRAERLNRRIKNLQVLKTIIEDPGGRITIKGIWGWGNQATLAAHTNAGISEYDTFILDNQGCFQVIHLDSSYQSQLECISAIKPSLPHAEPVQLDWVGRSFGIEVAPSEHGGGLLRSEILLYSVQYLAEFQINLAVQAAVQHTDYAGEQPSFQPFEEDTDGGAEEPCLQKGGRSWYRYFSPESPEYCDSHSHDHDSLRQGRGSEHVTSLPLMNQEPTIMSVSEAPSEVGTLSRSNSMCLEEVEEEEDPDLVQSPPVQPRPKTPHVSARHVQREEAEKPTLQGSHEHPHPHAHVSTTHSPQEPSVQVEQPVHASASKLAKVAAPSSQATRRESSLATQSQPRSYTEVKSLVASAHSLNAVVKMLPDEVQKDTDICKVKIANSKGKELTAYKFTHNGKEQYLAKWDYDKLTNIILPKLKEALDQTDKLATFITQVNESLMGNTFKPCHYTLVLQAVRAIVKASNPQKDIQYAELQGNPQLDLVDSKTEDKLPEVDEQEKVKLKNNLRLLSPLGNFGKGDKVRYGGLFCGLRPPAGGNGAVLGGSCSGESQETIKVVLQSIGKNEGEPELDLVRLQKERDRRESACGFGRREEVDIILAMTSQKRLTDFINRMEAEERMLPAELEYLRAIQFNQNNEASITTTAKVQFLNTTVVIDTGSPTTYGRLICNKCCEGNTDAPEFKEALQGVGLEKLADT